MQAKADKVIGKKKAFICVLLQAPQEASKELHDLIFKYWEAVDKNISTLEEKTGVVKKIFVEGIPGKGEDVAMNLKEASLGAWNVIEERRKTGAEISELENLENLQKVIDWSKCLNVGLTNRSVAEEISENSIHQTGLSNEIKSLLERNNQIEKSKIQKSNELKELNTKKIPVIQKMDEDKRNLSIDLNLNQKKLKKEREYE